MKKRKFIVLLIAIQILNGNTASPSFAYAATMDEAGAGGQDEGNEAAKGNEPEQSNEPAKPDKATKPIAASELDLGDYQTEMAIGEKLLLSVTILPLDAVPKALTYKSSDTGVARGTAAITATAGAIVKHVGITVKVPTISIDVDKTYLVLKPDETFALKASAMPKDAPQDITYKSLDPDIAEVAGDGTIRANVAGTAGIVVSNGDFAASVTVIVNEKDGLAETDPTDNLGIEDSEATTLSDIERKLLLQLAGGQATTVGQTEYAKVTKRILKALYQKHASLTIEGQGYRLTIHGDDIVNYENELSTGIDFSQEDGGTCFLLNGGKPLPGKLELAFTEGGLDGSYLYLYSQAKEKYELIDAKENRKLLLDEAGDYMATNEERGKLSLSMIMLIACLVCVLGVIAAYIFVKKKHWFW
ncbi:Ig-like domain-containing protein [Lachnospiraceae bacterium ZAX-1]